MSCKAIRLAFVCFTALTSLGNGDTLTLSPSLDNTLIQSSAGTLSNAEGNIYVGRTNQAAGVSIRRGLIEFDIADNLPAEATITGGTLTMTDATTGSNGVQTLSLYDVSRAWGQGTSYSSGGTGAAASNRDATWLYTVYNAGNPSASPAWTNPGGDFSSTLSGSTTDATNGQSVVWSSASNPQMTTDMQNWLDDPGTNFGWPLQGNESAGQTGKVLGAGPFYSGNGPTLTISYVVPEPSTGWLAIAGLIAMAVVKYVRPTTSTWCPSLTRLSHGKVNAV